MAFKRFRKAGGRKSAAAGLVGDAGSLSGDTASAPEMAAPRVDDSLGRRTRDLETGNPMRRFERQARILMISNLCLGLALMAMAMAIADLLPLRREIPYFVQTEPVGGQVVRLMPLRMDMEQTALLAETEAMKYVRMRHSVVPDTQIMSKRWGTGCLDRQISVSDRECAFIYKHSDRAVYEEFKRQNLQEVQRLIEQRVTREVEITVAPIDKGEGIYEVRFVLRDYQAARNGEPAEMRRRNFVATLWTHFRENETKREQRFLNPFGFTVTKYRLAEAQATVK